MDSPEEMVGNECPEFFEYYWNKAEEYEALKDYDNALECYFKCFELSKTHGSAAYEYWWLQGIPEFYNCFRTGPLTKIAEIYYTLGDYPTAADYYLSAVKCTPYVSKYRERYAEIKALIE